jgi:hypothetical protein
MKTSDKLILCLIFFLLLAPSFLKITERMCLKLEPPFSVPDFSGSAGAREGDTIVVTAPGDGVSWTRVTLGLRRSFTHGIIQDSSIFNDFNLEFLGNSCITRPFFKPFNQKTLCWLAFGYLPKESDSLKYRISGISVDIWKYKEKPESPRMFRYNNATFNEVESLPGVWNYWMHQSACCEWARGMWITTVRVPLQSCGNDSAKAVKYRDKIRDRLFVYYQSLK